MTSGLTREYLEGMGLNAQSPSLEYLAQIVRSHLGTYAFSSIGPRLGEDLPLDLESVTDRVVRRRRGGYCFEHNLLIKSALDDLGFTCALRLARVMLHDDNPLLDHRVTIVSLPDGEYLVDVGFGYPSPEVPLPMNGAEAGNDWHRYRVVAGEHALPIEYVVEAEQGDTWKPQYGFADTEYTERDCELGHFYSRCHPDAPFVNYLVASRNLDNEIRSLRGREYRLITPSGMTTTALLNAAELRHALASELDVHVTQDEATRLWGGLSPQSNG